jgi:hypothetical protein
MTKPFYAHRLVSPGLGIISSLCRRTVSGGRTFHRADLVQHLSRSKYCEVPTNCPRSFFSRRNAKSGAVTAVPADGIEAAS